MQKMFQISRPFGLDRRSDLTCKHRLVSRALQRSENSYRHRKFRVLHPSENIGQVRSRAILVMNENIVNRHAVFSDRDDFRVDSIEPDSLLLVLPEKERFAVLELDHPIFLDITLAEHLEGAVIEDI